MHYDLSQYEQAALKALERARETVNSNPVIQADYLAICEKSEEYKGIPDLASKMASYTVHKHSAASSLWFAELYIPNRGDSLYQSNQYYKVMVKCRTVQEMAVPMRERHAAYHKERGLQLQDLKHSPIA